MNVKLIVSSQGRRENRCDTFEVPDCLVLAAPVFLLLPLLLVRFSDLIHQLTRFVRAYLLLRPNKQFDNPREAIVLRIIYCLQRLPANV